MKVVVIQYYVRHSLSVFVDVIIFCSTATLFKSELDALASHLYAAVRSVLLTCTFVVRMVLCSLCKLAL